MLASPNQRDICLVKDLKYEDHAFNDDDDDDYDDDEEDKHNNNGDVDEDDGQVPVDVVADDIFPGLSFLFQKNGNALDMQLGWLFSCTFGRIFSDRN